MSLSSAEAEYTAASESARVIVAFRAFLAELLRHKISTPSRLYLDNTASIRMASELGGSPARRHIKVKHHWIREQVQDGEIEPKWVSTSQQIADIFTKPLPRIAFENLRSQLLHPAPHASIPSDPSIISPPRPPTHKT